MELTKEDLQKLISGEVKEALKPFLAADRKNLLPTANTETEKEKNAKTIVSFMKAVYEGNTAEIKALSEGTDSAGGFLVPAAFRAEVARELIAPFTTRSLATIIPMGSDKLVMPRLTSSVSVYWEGENATWTSSDAAFGTVTLTAKRLNGLNYMSRELFADSSVAIAQLIVTLFSEAIKTEEDNVFITGLGAKNWLGLQNQSGIGAVAQAGASLAGDDIIALFYELAQQYRKNAYWFLHNDIIELVRKLKDSNNKYLWTDGFSAAPNTLLGRPVVENNNIPVNLGGGTNESIIFFGDPKFYAIGDRQQMGVETTTQSDTAFTKHQVGTKVWTRTDGNLLIDAAFKKLTGVK